LHEAARQKLPDLPQLPHLRPAAIATWRGRMVNEYQSSLVFGSLALQAERAGLAARLSEELRELEAEERRHGVLCGSVVEALGGDARSQVATPRVLPGHASCAPLEAFLRNLLSVSCLSETVAVALIGAEREYRQGFEHLANAKKENERQHFGVFTALQPRHHGAEVRPRATDSAIAPVDDRDSHGAMDRQVRPLSACPPRGSRRRSGRRVHVRVHPAPAGAPDFQ